MTGRRKTGTGYAAVFIQFSALPCPAYGECIGALCPVCAIHSVVVAACQIQIPSLVNDLGKISKYYRTLLSHHPAPCNLASCRLWPLASRRWRFWFDEHPVSSM